MSVFFRRYVGCCLAAFAAVITLLQVNQKSFVLGSGMRKARRGKSFVFFDSGSCIKPHSIAFIFIYLVAQKNASWDAWSLWQLPEGEEHISNSVLLFCLPLVHTLFESHDISSSCAAFLALLPHL